MRKGNIGAIVAALVLPMAVQARGLDQKIGEIAPVFRFTTFDGIDHSSLEYRGKVLVLNFWATWCGPCRTELPLLSAYFSLQKKAGLQVVAVTTEDSAPIFKLKPLAAAVSFPMARRFRGGYAPLGALPTNYVIDRAGVLRYAKAGAFDLDDLNTLLVPLLQEPAPVIEP